MTTKSTKIICRSESHSYVAFALLPYSSESSCTFMFCNTLKIIKQPLVRKANERFTRKGRKHESKVY